MTTTLTIDIWSDVVCPWCYIGKRRFESAVERVLSTNPGLDLKIRYRAYQLDPTAPTSSSMPARDAYARKFGDRADAILAHLTETAAGDGLEFRFDIAQRANTLLCHRLLWWAAESMGSQAQIRLKERLLRAYFTEGCNVADFEHLTAMVATELDIEAHEVRSFIESDRGTDEVRDELAQAAAHDITGVPTYVINGAWAIPGAQDADTFERVLLRAVAARPG